jgi:acyl-CoA synthetase (AMP-forming)/AMP-acid ligase II
VHDQSWTYAEFDRLSDNIAANLLAAGLEPGDRIALHLANGPDLALGYFGCLRAGCIAVPVNIRLKGREVDYILRHSGSACYLGQPDLYGEIATSCPAVAVLEARYLTRGPSRGRIRPFEDLLRPPARVVSLPDVTADQLAAILYTSGTTARPKGVAHSHKTLAQTARAMRQIGLDQDQVALVMSSMAHGVGFGMLFLSGLLNGATVVITRALDAANALKAHERWRCTYTLALPVTFQFLLQEQIANPRDVSSCRSYFCGGDSVSPALQEAFRPLFGPLYEAYGLTEMTPASWNRPGQMRAGSLGQPGEEVGFRLVDSEGRDVKQGEVGEICVQGPHLMVGYWQDPEATAAAIQDGWFHTGDLARSDRDDYYWFAGRKKEIIIRGGSNISPQEVEAVLYDHPAVAEAGVVGRRTLSGEKSLWPMLFCGQGTH